MTVGKQPPEQPVPPLSTININMCTRPSASAALCAGGLGGLESPRPKGSQRRGSVVRGTRMKRGKGQDVAKRQSQAGPQD